MYQANIITNSKAINIYVAKEKLTVDNFCTHKDNSSVWKQMNNHIET